MGDRTNLSIIIFDCPEDQVDAVLDILESYGLDDDWNVRSASSLSELQLGEAYVVNEASCGSSDEIAGALIEQAPGASFDVHEDPAYEWLGSLNRYTPDLGAFGAECDANGQPQFTVDVILKAVDEAPPVQGALFLDALKRRLGEPWVEEFAALATANKDKVLPRTDVEEPDGAPCCADPGCGGSPQRPGSCTFPGYADNH